MKILYFFNFENDKIINIAVRGYIFIFTVKNNKKYIVFLYIDLK